MTAAAVVQLHDEESRTIISASKLRDACADRSGPPSIAISEVKRLIAEGADINTANRNGKCAVHFAAQLRSDTDVLSLLLELKADVNATTHRGHTPLIYACGRQRIEVVDFLLAHGADAATWTVQGVCAVSMARSKSLPPELIERLEANQRASTNPRDFKDDPRALLAQQEWRRMNGGRLSASAERLEIHESADWLPQQVEAEIAGLAVRLGDAAAQGTNALTAALLCGAD